MIFEVGQERTLSLKSGSFSGLSFVHHLQGAAVNVPINSYPSVDYSGVSISIDLYQDDRKETIYSGKMLQLLMAQHLMRNTFSDVQPFSSDHKNHVLTESSLARKELSTCGINFDFGTVINLKGSDKIEVSIDMDFDTYQAEVDSSTSYLDVEGISGVGVQDIIPKFTAKPITDIDDNPVFELGNNVLEVGLINIDKSDNLASSQVCERVTFSSDRLNYRKPIEQMIIDRAMNFSTRQESEDRFQSYPLASFSERATDYDKVKVELDLNIDKVNPSQNYLVWQSYISSPEIQNRSVYMSKNHASYLQKKINSRYV